MKIFRLYNIDKIGLKNKDINNYRINENVLNILDLESQCID